MRQQRFFKDAPKSCMKGAQAFFMLIPFVWGLSDAAKGDTDNALIKLLWFILMLGSYLNGYWLGDSNRRPPLHCALQHYRPQCDLPHFPENAKFDENKLPVEIAPKDIEPGLEIEGREDSKKLKL